MSKKAALDLVRRVESCQKLLPATDALTFMKEMQSVWVEKMRTDREIAAIQSQKEVMLEEIRGKNALWKEIFQETFSERRMAITKSFEIIDKGLARDDNELVARGMQGLADIISASPIASAIELAKALQSNKRIEI